MLQYFKLIDVIKTESIHRLTTIDKLQVKNELSLFFFKKINP